MLLFSNYTPNFLYNFWVELLDNDIKEGGGGNYARIFKLVVTNRISGFLCRNRCVFYGHRGDK